ncbi:MAG: hypothetical protein AAF153_01775, partial [Pseudomonadota bacterium]
MHITHNTGSYKVLQPLKVHYNLDEAKLRLVMLLMFLTLIMTMIITSIVNYNIEVRSPTFSSIVKKVNNHERLEIVDRQGVLLATNLSVNSVYAIPSKVLDVA